jgi:thiaminase
MRFGLVRLDSVSVDDIAVLRLGDKEVSLNQTGLEAYRSLEHLFLNDRLDDQVVASDARLSRALFRFLGEGLVYRLEEDKPAKYSAPSAVAHLMQPLIKKWIEQAFAHPFWDRMTRGDGSRVLYAGWLFELYHYTRNANRHMPLAVAYARTTPKAVKTLLTKHYHEEWNHYHFFSKALKGLGYSEEAIATSCALPMTLEMSNFMRQAARENLLGYSLCSAILEGTTVDSSSYGKFYEEIVRHYEVPRDAIQPIFDHLDLDRQYAHSDLFADTLETIGEISSVEVEEAIQYGAQMAQHVWAWTQDIEQYYGNPNNLVPRTEFDPFQ